jgi:two-component system chemotaxis response regulator CheB
MLDDGTSGLWSIKRLGGTAIIQKTSDARFESMPRNAMEYVEPDYIRTSGEIGELLAQLAREPMPQAATGQSDLRQRIGLETRIAAENGAFQKGVMDLGELTPFTCPECHGALVKISEGKMSRFRCHTGHAYTDSALLEGVMETTGEMLWQVMRSLEEAVMLLRHMADHLEEAGSTDRAKAFRHKAGQLEQRSRTFHDAVLDHESLSGDNLAQSSED